MGSSTGHDKEILINNFYMEIGGKPVVPVMGEFHYNRVDSRYWRDVLMKMKASGINIVSTYCLWILHEEFEGQQNWEGQYNLKRFIELCGELELLVHLRIGPYSNAEIINGGLPNWVVRNEQLMIRTNDPLYLSYANRWYQSIYNQVEGLFYKDGGPIFAIQLENEYVRKGMVITHLMKLKEMAVKIGYDVPLYSMTHWLDSEYPLGEIIPYAGFYIETPWTGRGKEELPLSNFEFFTYNRLSDNIGTDLIKIENEVQFLAGDAIESPFFTCEIGVGTTSFYNRRAIVPQEMAGENINLRLGCGVNLMGYYMYAGGSNPIGTESTFQSSGPRVNYDYQAPIREFGTLGNVLWETKKYNYFMNDFGESLALAKAYLPISNQDRNNLQWSVRYDGMGGYLFCSNTLYRYSRPTYKDVQFKLICGNEEILIPRKGVDIKDGAYFFWPYNQNFGGVLVKYATVQPITTLNDKGVLTYFSFQDDNIDAEYMFDARTIKSIKSNGAKVKKEGNFYFIDSIVPGLESSIDITLRSGVSVRFITLTEEHSDYLWKGKNQDRDFVVIAKGAVISDRGKVTIISDSSKVESWNYLNGHFKHKVHNKSHPDIKCSFENVTPMAAAFAICGNSSTLSKEIMLRSLSSIESATLRYSSTSTFTKVSINGKEITSRQLDGYYHGIVSNEILLGKNHISFTLPPTEQLLAEIEIVMRNGERIVWCTDNTWLDGAKSIQENQPKPVTLGQNFVRPEHFDKSEHLALYKIACTNCERVEDEESRLYISYLGDIANLYLNY